MKTNKKKKKEKRNEKPKWENKMWSEPFHLFKKFNWKFESIDTFGECVRLSIFGTHTNTHTHTHSHRVCKCTMLIIRGISNKIQTNYCCLWLHYNGTPKTVNLLLILLQNCEQKMIFRRPLNPINLKAQIDHFHLQTAYSWFTNCRSMFVVCIDVTILNGLLFFLLFWI